MLLLIKIIPCTRNYIFLYIHFHTSAGIIMSHHGPWYYIKSMHSGYVLDIQGAEDGANIIQYTPGGGDNQLWQLNGTSIVSRSGLALDVEGAAHESGTNAIGWTHSHGAENQSWRIEGDKIISTLNGLCLDIQDGSTDESAAIILYEPVYGGVNNQSWQFVAYDG